MILKRNKNLDEKQKDSLQNIMDNNANLYVAYILKEQILNILETGGSDIGMKRLDKWFSNVEATGFSEFVKVVKTIKKYLYGIENYFKHGLTNAPSEAFNNKINVIKRRAYGFKDLQYFMFKILQLCGPSSPITKS